MKFIATLLGLASMLSVHASWGQAPASAPAASGVYEAYSPLTGGPVGTISQAKAAAVLGHWLEVTTTGSTSEIIFAPERVVRWRLEHGPHGVVKKTTIVDAVPWTTSVFGYDAAGHLATKTVTGTGASFAATYRTAPDGRVLERANTTAGERWLVQYDARGAAAQTLAVGQVVRRDRYDTAGRLLRTELGKPGSPALVVTYVRDARGELTRVIRTLPGRGDRTAGFATRDKDVTAEDLDKIPPSTSRDEVLLFLGSPVTHSTSGSGSARTSGDSYSAECWLNQTSTLKYDASDAISSKGQGCICGFCVDASAPIAATDVMGRDTHWTAGPWLRLDEAVDVTADHRVLTPSGPRAAGTLRPGDVVLGADGTPRKLASVRTLDPVERLGVNVRTRSGRFTSGNFVFESEQPRACP